MGVLDIARYWPNGEEGGWVLGLSNLADIDLDDAVAARLAVYFLPPTGMIGGRDNRPATHWYYRGRTGHSDFPVAPTFAAARPPICCLFTAGTRGVGTSRPWRWPGR
ncbi:MAG: hypothetical protein RMJ88_14905 [Thermogemmata sp.]|nr:hypothetical protein [Thermogemmata sp.]